MRNTILAVILVMCSVIGVGCGSKQVVSTPKPTTPISAVESTEGKLVLLEMSASGVVPIVIAQEQGYFKKYGLSVEQSNIADPKQLTTLIQSGKIDGAGLDVVTAVNLNTGGTKVNITSKMNDRLIVVANQTIEKLKAKGAPIKVGMSRKDIIEYMGVEYFKSIGIDLYNQDQVEIISIPKPLARLEMINTGNVDVAILNETLGIVAVERGAKLLANSDELGIQTGCILFTETALKNKSKEIEDFYKAYNDAIDYITSTPREEYIKRVIVKAQYPKNIKEDIILPSYTKAALPSQEQITYINDWMNKVGITDKKLKFEEITKNVVIK